MSEIKRAQLIPLGSQKQPDKSSKESRKTVRVSVVLPESTEDTCPEYNYKDELAAAKKREKSKEDGGVPNGLSGFTLEDDDDDVKRIARQMEEKYGGTSLNKKKRKIRKDDYADIGMGYDESDSFIDNTDGYDEMIPQNVTTLHGGFYINSGALEFKTDDEANSDCSSSSSEDEGSPKKSPNKKRIIDSSDETDRENKTEVTASSKHMEKKRKLQNGGNGLQPSLKKKLLSPNNIYVKKKRRILDGQKKTVKELLKEKRVDLDMSIPEDLKCDSMIEGQNNKEKGTISSVTDVIESVVKASIGDSKVVETVANSKNIVNLSSDGESSHEKSAKSADVKLPENLPADILSIITAISTAAERNSDSKNIFSSEINLLILRLERKCKCLGKPSKTKVYEHLSNFLHCKAEFLVKRAKSLVFEDEHKKLKNLLSTLRLEVNKIMPSLLEIYEKESQRVLQKRFSQESTETDENKCLRMPKRRFQWNDVTKKLLKDILMLKKRCLLLEGKGKDVLDPQMTAFLKTEIQVIWPDGWMSMNALNKIYTTYADPKRMLPNGAPQTTTGSQPKPPSCNPVKNLPPSLSNSNLSITPVVVTPKSEVSGTKIHDVSVKSESNLNLLMKTSPAGTSQPCDIIPALPKKELENKLKVKPQTELLKASVSNHVSDEVIILDTTAKNERLSPTKEKFQPKTSDENYCQVIDLSDKNDISKIKPAHPKREKTISPMLPDQLNHVGKHHELSIIPSYPKADQHSKSKSTAGDDIQKVMENLKVLQKMSSPKKSVESTKKIEPSSSAVSVIAVNKSFAPKPVNENSTLQRYDYKTSEYSASSFQDEFQKQLFGVLNQIQPNANKSYNSVDRYPHIASSGPSLVTGDKFYQNSSNSYTQSSNGHRSNSTGQQPGTYSILDDMFANLLTQYGYTKEAASSKSQPK